MNASDRQRLKKARDSLIDAIQAIPDPALDWRPSSSEWSNRQVLAHVTHANDFYTMIVHEVLRSAFRSVDLVRDSADYRAMMATDEAVMKCATTAMAVSIFESTFGRFIAALDSAPPDDLGRSFALTYEWRRADPPERTNLRERVMDAAIDHIREHAAELRKRGAVLARST
jgi:hypothetical protein